MRHRVQQLRARWIELPFPATIITVNPLEHTSSSLRRAIETARRLGIELLFRINFSYFHEKIQDIYRTFLDQLRKLAPQALLEGDLPGAKMRLPQGFPKILVAVGDKIVMSARVQKPGRRRKVLELPLFYPWLPAYVEPGQLLIFGDDEIRCRVIKVGENILHLTVEALRPGARLRRGIGLTIPADELPFPPITSQDELAVAFAADEGVEILALSLINTPAELERWAAYLDRRFPTWDPILLPKLETMKALDNLPLFAAKAGIAMLAQGDLWAKLAAWSRLPELARFQETFVEELRKAQGISILATGLLTWPPTQAGVASLAHVFGCLRPSAVLFPETASLKEPVELLEFVVKVAKATVREVEVR